MKTNFITCLVLCFAMAVNAQKQQTNIEMISIDDVNVSLDASHPITTELLRVPRADDFERLDIRFRNDGSEAVVIRSIDITIPFAEAFPASTEVVYGSSCMGQRPLRRETVADEGNRSYSYMFSMVKADDDFHFAGSLSWRVFLPEISVNEQGFRIQAEGEGKQIEPGETLFFEALVLGQTRDWYATLDQFGSAIARENDISSVTNDRFM